MRYKAFLIPNPAGAIWATKDNKVVSFSRLSTAMQPNILIIVDTKDTIKEGDWIIGAGNIYQVYSISSTGQWVYTTSFRKTFVGSLRIGMYNVSASIVKIIASTNPEHQLPGITSDSIQKWIDNGCPEDISLEKTEGICNCGKSDYGYICSGAGTKEECESIIKPKLTNNQVSIISENNKKIIQEKIMATAKNFSIDESKVDKMEQEAKEYSPNSIQQFDFYSGAKWQSEQDKNDAVEFAEWLPRNAQPITINKNWILNSDRKEYTTEQLYELFKQSKL